MTGPLPLRRCRKRRAGHDLTGHRSGKLVALEKVGQDQWRNYIWLCQCDCGRQSKVPSFAIKNGTIRSCGCLWTFARWAR